jgi:hypothetical protein
MSKLERRSSGLEANIIMRIGKAIKEIKARSRDGGYVVETVKVLKTGNDADGNVIAIETGDEGRKPSEIYWEWVEGQMSSEPDKKREDLN